ncbi:MAG: glycosyltransferase family 4 protein [Thermoplasmatota archaeon]
MQLVTDTAWDANGVSRFVQDLAREAAARGRDLEVLTSTRRSGPAHPLIRNLVPRYARPYRRYPDLEFTLPPVRAMLAHIRRRDPDVIHVSTPGPVGLVGVLAARLYDKPLVGIYHTDFPGYIEQLYGRRTLVRAAQGYMRSFYRLFATVGTRSDAYLPVLQQMGLPGHRLTSLTAGSDTATFHPRHRRADPAGFWAAYPGDPTRRKLLYVGRISHDKHLGFLAPVWEALRQRGDVDLLLIGDGPHRRELEAALPGAHFLGHRAGDELATLYANSDLFLFPSVKDTLGQVVMEAQASGVPALVSDQGGPQHIVTDQVTGHVLPVTDPAPWIAAATALLDDEAARRQIGDAARAQMEQRGFAASFEHWWRLHEEVQRPRPPRPHVDPLGRRRAPPLTPLGIQAGLAGF